MFVAVMAVSSAIVSISAPDKIVGPILRRPATRAPAPARPLADDGLAESPVGMRVVFGRMPKPSATPQQVAAVRPGVEGSEVATLLGEWMLSETYRTRNYARTATQYYPSLVVTVGPDGKVTKVEPNPPD